MKFKGSKVLSCRLQIAGIIFVQLVIDFLEKCLFHKTLLKINLRNTTLKEYFQRKIVSNAKSD